MATIGESVSRLRGIIKANNIDAFVTDRFLYSLVVKYSHSIIRRDNVLNTIINFNSIIKTIPCLELIEVDKVSDSCCLKIKSGCKIMRSKNKIPSVVECKYGPLFRAVMTIDGSSTFTLTTPDTFNSIVKSTNYKYNKTKYYWFVDEYLYFPNVTYDAVKVEGIFEEDINSFLCSKKDDCILKQEEQVFVPDYLLGEIEALAQRDLMTRDQIPSEDAHNKLNINR